MRLLGALLAILMALAVGSGAEKSTPAERLPNLVLITVDTLRADHLSCYGYHLATSPNIDQLASEGVRFERVYSPIPLTGPSHISLFTSRFPQEHGARINGVAVPQDSKWLFLPQILRKLGYRNAAFVSAWTLTNRLTQLGQWFDTYDEDLTRSHQFFHSSRFAEDVTPPAIEWLRGNRHRPFFLWVHYFDPHSPYHLREEFASPAPNGYPGNSADWADKEAQKRINKYDSEIGYVDHHIGKLLAELDDLELRESTLVALTADHGESLGEHGYVGHGRRLFEGIVHIPLILRYPGTIPAGRVIPQATSLLDLAPTVLELALGKEKAATLPVSFAGRSSVPAIVDGESLPQRPIRYVAFAGRKGFAPRWVSWLWVRDSTLPLHVGETVGFRKLVWTPGEKSLSVVNLEQDPLELRPAVLREGDTEYYTRAASLKRWFEATDLEEGEITMNKRDIEVLKSLGYLQ